MCFKDLPTGFDFLNALCSLVNSYNHDIPGETLKEAFMLSQYLLEISLLSSFGIKQLPSIMAVACLSLAMKSYRIEPGMWTGIYSPCTNSAKLFSFSTFQCKAN